MKTSYSMLAIARTCRRKFLWSFQGPPIAIDMNPRKKNMFIGHVLQKAVERFYVEKWWKNPDTLTQTFKEAMSKAANDFTASEGIQWDGEGEKQGWVLLAHETIPQIISVIKSERLLTKEVQSEYNVQLPIEHHVIYGRADFIIPQSQSLLVIDGKGGRTYGKYADPDQLVFYGLGLKQDPKYLKFPDRLGFWWFRHTKIQWRRFKLEKQTEFINLSRETLDLIEKKDYTPTPGNHCFLCDFKQQCDVGTDYLKNKHIQITDLDIPDNCSTVSLE